MQISINFENEVIAPKILCLLEKFKDDGVEIIEIVNNKEDFMISSVQEIQDRVKKAESNSKYIEHNEFWKEI